MSTETMNEITGSESPKPENGYFEHERVEELAYQLWLDRGCPIGSPENDWLRAEQELRNQTERSEGGQVVEAAANLG
jgi:hypothetical protein